MPARSPPGPAVVSRPVIGKARDDALPLRPWAAPEITSVEPAADALRAAPRRAIPASSGSSSTARGGSSCSPPPRRRWAASGLATELAVPGSLDPAGVRRRPRRGRPAALHERPDAVARPAAAPAGRPQPDRRLRARGRGPGGLGRPPDRAARRRRRERPAGPRSTVPTSASARTPTWRASSTSPRTCAPGEHQHASGSPSSSGPTRPTSRTRTSGGTAASPAPVFLYATAPRAPRATSTSWPTSPPDGAGRRPAARGRDGDRLAARRRPRGRPGRRRPGRAGRVDPAARAGPRSRPRPGAAVRACRLAGRPARFAGLPAVRRAGSSTCARRASSSTRRGRRPGKPASNSPAGRSGWAGSGSRRGPGRHGHGRRSCRSCTTSRSPCTARTARRSSARRYRIGFRRVEIVGNDLLVNGVRVMIRGVNRHDFDPLRGRTISRRAVPRRPADDEAVRVQRRPDVALPERPRPARRRRRARAVRRRRGRHRVPRLRPPRRGHARVPAGVRRPGLADGPPGREPPERDPLVARQRERLRRQPRRGRRLGPPLRPDPPAALRGRDHVRLDRRRRPPATSPARCTRRSSRWSRTPAPASSGTR